MSDSGAGWHNAAMSNETPAVDETVERMEVARTIPEPPERIFALLSDPRGHVTIDSSGMLIDSTGEPATKVGDEFVIHMDREALNDFPMGRYDVTVHITTFELDREIAWTIQGQIKPQIGHIYGYRLEPAEGGTLVTSYYDWSTHRPAVERGQHLPDHSRVGAAGNVGDSGAHTEALGPVVTTGR